MTNQADKTQLKRLVLVIDDDPSMLHIMRAVLEGEGFEVETVADGAEALLLVERGRYALIVSDVLMPGRIGARSLIEALAESQGAPPVLIVSAYWDAEPELREFLSARAAACLTKPFDINDFRRIVRNVLGSAP